MTHRRNGIEELHTLDEWNTLGYRVKKGQKAVAYRGGDGDACPKCGAHIDVKFHKNCYDCGRKLKQGHSLFSTDQVWKVRDDGPQRGGIDEFDDIDIDDAADRFEE
jgi:ribosomal protein S27AE